MALFHSSGSILRCHCAQENLDAINASIRAFHKDHAWIPSINSDLWHNGNELPPAPSIAVKRQAKVITRTALALKEMETDGGDRPALPDERPRAVGASRTRPSDFDL